MQSFAFPRSVFASSVAASAMLALVVAACSDDGGSQPLPTKPQTPPTSSTGSDMDPTDPPDTDKPKADGGTADGGLTCDLKPRAAGDGPYCPRHRASDDAGADAGTVNGNCAAGEQCCSFTTAQGATDAGAFPTSYCATSCTPTDPNPLPQGIISAPFECNADDHCGTGKLCCLYAKAGATGLSINNDTKCPGKNFGRVGGSACRATCGMGETPLCGADSDCPAGSKCTRIAALGRDVAYCK